MKLKSVFPIILFVMLFLNACSIIDVQGKTNNGLPVSPDATAALTSPAVPSALDLDQFYAGTVSALLYSSSPGDLTHVSKAVSIVSTGNENVVIICSHLFSNGAVSIRKISSTQANMIDGSNACQFPDGTFFSLFLGTFFDSKSFPMNNLGSVATSQLQSYKTGILGALQSSINLVSSNTDETKYTFSFLGTDNSTYYILYDLSTFTAKICHPLGREAPVLEISLITNFAYDNNAILNSIAFKSNLIIGSGSYTLFYSVEASSSQIFDNANKSNFRNLRQTNSTDTANLAACFYNTD